jgi:hypothetical protein
VKGEKFWGDSVLDSNSGRSVVWIRILIGNADPEFRRAKITYKMEKVKKFDVLKCRMFSFES